MSLLVIATAAIALLMLGSGGRAVEAQTSSSQCTVFGTGVDGSGPGQLSDPGGVFVDGAGNLFIADTGNSRVLRVDAASGLESTVGSGLTFPFGVFVDGAGNVFIADTVNDRVVRVNPAGVQSTVGTGLSIPRDVFVDGAGNVFIADMGNHRVLRVDGSSGVQSTVGSGLDSPGGVFVDGAGNVFIADTFNHRVVRVDPAGVESTVGTGLFFPFGLSSDGAGNIFIADSGNDRVVRVDGASGVQSTVGSGLNSPEGVFVDGGGNVFIADTFNHRVVAVGPMIDCGAPSTFGASYVALAPGRLLDTRGAPLQTGEFSTAWSAGLPGKRSLQVTGVAGVPATGVEAVALHITTVNPTAAFSWLTIDPTGATASTTAVHNFGTNPATTELVNDLIVAKVGAGGKIDITNAGGTVDLVIDVVGYFATDSGAGFEPLAPTRLLDTRAGLQQGEFSSAWTPGLQRDLQVTGTAGVPTADVVAVALNITTVNPTAAFSWLTIDPTGAPASTTALHNFGTAAATSQLVNDLVIAKVGTGGKISITNAFGNVDLVIDVVGYYTTSGGSMLVPLDPVRLLDTRNTTEGDFDTPWPAGGSREITNTRFAGCTAVAVHMTTVSPTAAFSWLTVTPETSTGGTAAHNFGTNPATTELVNDLIVAKLGPNNSFWINNAHGTTDLVIDIVGLYDTNFTTATTCSP